MDSSTFSYPSTDLWKPVTSRSCTRRRCNPHSGFGFRVLQLETRNQKLGTFTSSNHISQNRRLTTEDFHHRKQGLSPQNPKNKRECQILRRSFNLISLLRMCRQFLHFHKSVSCKIRKFYSTIAIVFGDFSTLTIQCLEYGLCSFWHVEHRT